MGIASDCVNSTFSNEKANTQRKHLHYKGRSGASGNEREAGGKTNLM